MTTKLPQIAIIGAGLSGLTLGLSLKHKGIAAIIYDRATSSPRYNYGITLYPSTYRPLLKILEMDEAAFREKLAVNAQQGGTGSLTGTDAALSSEGFRCHRGRLEALLGNGLSFKWDMRLNNVQLAPNSKHVTATFDGGSTLDTECLIGCDGPHSMTRQSLSSSMQLEVLPYVVFNGKRQIPLQEFQDNIHPLMQEAVILHKRIGNVLLEVSINDITNTHVILSYVYSRPSKGDKDPLHKPNRPVAGATDIPEELYDELDELKDLEAPYNDIFDSEKVRDDRVLHWLMRCLTPDAAEAARLSEHGVVLIGDAVHATPILGGEGANIAIQDGLDLAEYISAHGVKAFEHFAAGKSNKWTQSVADSKKKIEELHNGKASHL